MFGSGATCGLGGCDAATVAPAASSESFRHWPVRGAILGLRPVAFGNSHNPEFQSLALQLSFFEVGTLSGGLVSSAPE